MKNKLFLFLILLTFSQSAFSQNATTEKRPQAYLFSGGDKNSATKPIEKSTQAYLFSSGDTNPSRGAIENRPQAYLVSSGDTNSALNRPRVVKAVAGTLKASNAFDLERRAFELVNYQRATLGFEPLAWSDDAAKIARLHSENMANFNFFSHSGIDGSMVNDRADAFGINKWRAIGENIAYNQGYENPVEFAVERWMKSPSHRENLLNSRWKESGIGIAVTHDGTYYFTEVFLVRK